MHAPRQTGSASTARALDLEATPSASLAGLHGPNLSVPWRLRHSTHCDCPCKPQKDGQRVANPSPSDADRRALSGR